MITNEIPIDSGDILQEAQSASKFIVESVLHLLFLDPVAFLTSAGNVSKLGDPTDLTSRQSDITYVRFRCTMHGSSVDDRVKTSRSYHFIFIYGYHSMLTMNRQSGPSNFLSNQDDNHDGYTTFNQSGNNFNN